MLVFVQVLRPESLPNRPETGVRQPLAAVTEVLQDHPAWFHTDATQGFGKEIDALQNPRLDLISISGHKIYALQGIGALVMCRWGYERPPLNPRLTGDQALVMDHVLNLAFPGLDSKALMVALKDLIAISNGSAGTSTGYMINELATGVTDHAINNVSPLPILHPAT